MEKTLFSTPELAEWLGVFHTTVRRWIERGRIKGIRVGRNYKIPADEVIRILEGHSIPLPEVVRKCKNRQQREGGHLPSRGDYRGSILQKLLVVEQIGDPAFICRKAAILGANQAFADLVGSPQADLIGLHIGDVVDERSEEGLIDFAKRRVETPEEGPDDYVAHLKVGGNGGKEIRVTAGSLDDMKDIYIVIVREQQTI
jgi:excisionase family DNA binding protein